MWNYHIHPVGRQNHKNRTVSYSIRKKCSCITSTTTSPEHTMSTVEKMFVLCISVYMQVKCTLILQMHRNSNCEVACVLKCLLCALLICMSHAIV